MICIWFRWGRPVLTLNFAKKICEGSLTSQHSLSLCIHSIRPVHICFSLHHPFQVWDLRRTYSMYRGDPVPRDRFSHPGDSARTGFTSLRLSDRFAYAGCMDSRYGIRSTW